MMNDVQQWHIFFYSSPLYKIVMYIKFMLYNVYIISPLGGFVKLCETKKFHTPYLTTWYTAKRKTSSDAMNCEMAAALFLEENSKQMSRAYNCATPQEKACHKLVGTKIGFSGPREE